MQRVWGLGVGNLVRGRFSSNPNQLEQMIKRGDSSQRWYGELRMVELVESESAVDEGGLDRVWGRL